jgi:pimeloyl-ACP methyl ester carboxylesterase
MSQAAGVETIRTGDLEIAYETFGDPASPPLVLVMGLATQMLGWPQGFCEGLAERGFHVVRFDNRDVGLSTHLDDKPAGDLGALLRGDLSSASYTLSDMATDTVGLLDALGFDSVHLVGASMGGMIAQTVAIEHPERVRTLTSIMSTTGDPTVGGPTQAAMAVLLRPPATDREAAIEGAVGAYRVIGSPGYPLDEEALREQAGLAYDRAYDPNGVSRQLAAIYASGDRTPKLADVQLPTLVIHGDSDALVGVTGGRATAAAIPGAELEILEGMGHNFPRELWGTIADRIAAHAGRARAD